MSVQDCVVRDDPVKYTYKVQIREEEKPHAVPKAGEGRKKDSKSKYSGSLMDVKCPNRPILFVCEYIGPHVTASDKLSLHLRTTSSIQSSSSIS